MGSCCVLPPTSDPPDETLLDESTPQIHRSNSAQDMFESAQMQAVEFGSVIDPDDYWQNTEKIGLDKIPEELNNGKFRKKNKKKRGKRRSGELEPIVEEEEEEVNLGKKGQKMGKRKKGGGLNNFIYWREPEDKKKRSVAQVFKENEKEIMNKIHEKQSEFDSITQNDIIFREEQGQEDSMDYNEEQEQSRRAIRPTYDAYFNLNYAKRKHLN